MKDCSHWEEGTSKPHPTPLGFQPMAAGIEFEYINKVEGYILLNYKGIGFPLPLRNNQRTDQARPPLTRHDIPV